LEGGAPIVFVNFRFRVCEEFGADFVEAFFTPEFDVAVLFVPVVGTLLAPFAFLIEVKFVPLTDAPFLDTPFFGVVLPFVLATGFVVFVGGFCVALFAFVLVFGVVEVVDVGVEGFAADFAVGFSGDGFVDVDFVVVNDGADGAFEESAGDFDTVLGGVVDLGVFAPLGVIFCGAVLET